MRILQNSRPVKRHTPSLSWILPLKCTLEARSYITTLTTTTFFLVTRSLQQQGFTNTEGSLCATNVCSRGFITILEQSCSLMYRERKGMLPIAGGGHDRKHSVTLSLLAVEAFVAPIGLRWACGCAMFALSSRNLLPQEPASPQPRSLQLILILLDLRPTAHELLGI